MSCPQFHHTCAAQSRRTQPRGRHVLLTLRTVSRRKERHLENAENSATRSRRRVARGRERWHRTQRCDSAGDGDITGTWYHLPAFTYIDCTLGGIPSLVTALLFVALACTFDRNVCTYHVMSYYRRKPRKNNTFSHARGLACRENKQSPDPQNQAMAEKRQPLMAMYGFRHCAQAV